MSLATGVVLAVGIATACILLVFAVGLVQQLKRLRASVSRFRQDVQPVLDEVQRESERAQDRIEELSRKSQATGLGARIRR